MNISSGNPDLELELAQKEIELSQLKDTLKSVEKSYKNEKSESESNSSRQAKKIEEQVCCRIFKPAAVSTVMNII